MDILKLVRSCRPKASKWKGERFRWAEKKYDGFRVLIHKDARGRVKAYSKKFYIDIWPKLNYDDRLVASVASLPCNSIVEGEAHNFRQSSDFATVLAVRGPFHFHAFAMPFCNDVMLIDGDIRVVRSMLSDFGFKLTEIVPYEGVPDRERMLSMIAIFGIEGFVLKISHYRTWMKLKPDKEFDGIVTGFKEGEHDTKLEGQVGSLEVSVWKMFPVDEEGLFRPFHLVPVASVGSLSDARRQEIDADREGTLGRVVEVTHEGFQVNACRFPRFARWRDDKPSDECTFDQLEE